MKLHLGHGRNVGSGASVRSQKSLILKASRVPEEENRIVPKFQVSQECNQRGLCCGAQGNP